MQTINDVTNGNIIPETQHYSFDGSGKIFNQKSMGELTSLYLNISSLPKNISKLQYYLNSMNSIVDIIAISESKITKTVNIGFENYISIPNYTLINSPSLSFFGALLFLFITPLNLKFEMILI